MPRIITDAELLVYQPEVNTPHVAIPSTDLGEIEITHRIQSWKDTADFAINAAGGQYVDEITSGDKLVFRGYDADPHRSDPTGGQYDRTRYGEGTHGGAYADKLVEWVGCAHSPTLTDYSGDRLEMDVRAGGFVGEVLSFRKPFATYQDRQIAEDESNLADGEDPSAIVNDLVQEHAPEIDRSGIGVIDTVTSRSIAGGDLLSVLQNLAETGDAVMAAEGETLIFTTTDGLIRQFELTTDDYGVLSVTGDDDNLANDWRLVGGEDTDLDEEQTVVDEFFTVTDSNYLTVRLNPEKQMIKFGSLYTRKNDNSRDSLRMRIQRGNDNDTGPAAPQNDRVDIDNAQLTSDFIAEDGWIEKGFRFRKNVLPPDPWLIVDATGPDGHHVGVKDNPSDEPGGGGTNTLRVELDPEEDGYFEFTSGDDIVTSSDTDSTFTLDGYVTSWEDNGHVQQIYWNGDELTAAELVAKSHESTDKPAFKTFYPYDVTTKDSDPESIAEYRERQEVRRDQDVVNFAEARDLTEAYLRHNKTPDHTIDFEAISLRAHQLQPPDMVELNRPDLGVDGKWVVVERNDVYNPTSNLLRTTVTLQELASI